MATTRNGGPIELLSKTPSLVAKRDRLGTHVRTARPDDALRVASVLRESFAEYEPLYTREAFAATTPTGEHVLGRIGEGVLWVALRDDVTVGTLAAIPRGEALYLRGMAVLPAARGLGIGGLLLTNAESYAAGQEYKQLVLSTTPFLTCAISLYEHFGFRRSGEGPHDLFGTPLFTMVKDINVRT
jgi:GNAT superfamily N-acetyltransferase